MVLSGAIGAGRGKDALEGHLHISEDHGDDLQDVGFSVAVGAGRGEDVGFAGAVGTGRGEDALESHVLEFDNSLVAAADVCVRFLVLQVHLLGLGSEMVSG